MKPSEAPVLEDWVLASEIVEELGISRQTVNQMFHAGEFDTLVRLGKGKKPLFAVSRKEYDKIKATRTFPRSKKSEEVG